VDLCVFIRCGPEQETTERAIRCVDQCSRGRPEWRNRVAGAPCSASGTLAVPGDLEMLARNLDSHSGTATHHYRGLWARSALTCRRSRQLVLTNPAATTQTSTLGRAGRHTQSFFMSWHRPLAAPEPVWPGLRGRRSGSAGVIKTYTSTGEHAPRPGFVRPKASWAGITEPGITTTLKATTTVAVPSRPTGCSLCR
jgi:hypothetical protein